MIPLYAPLPYHVDYKGRRYRLKPYFDRVIEALDTMHRKDINPEDALSYVLYLLIDSKHYPLEIELLSAILNVLIEPTKEKAPRSIDFTQDATLIYSAFMQTYRIDLKEERRLHWWTFSALLAGLPSDTRLMEVIKVRTMDVPKPTKYNAEQIEEIMRLKAKYKIRLTDEEAAAQYQSDKQTLAQRLMNQ